MGDGVHALGENLVQAFGGIGGKGCLQCSSLLGRAHAVGGLFHVPQNVGQITKISVGILHRYLGFADFNGAVFHLLGDVPHNGRHRRAGFTALHALVGHSLQQAGDRLHVLPGRVQVGGTVFVSFSQLLRAGVAVCLRVGHQVGKIRGPIGFQAKRGQVIRHHIRGGGQIHAGSGGQIQHGGQGLCGLIGIPAGQRHIAQSIRRFAGRECGIPAHCQRGIPQLLKILFIGTGKRADLGHGAVKIRGRLYACRSNRRHGSRYRQKCLPGTADFAAHILHFGTDCFQLLGCHTAKFLHLAFQAFQLALGGGNLAHGPIVLLLRDGAGFQLVLQLAFHAFQAFQLAFGILNRSGQQALLLLQQFGVGGVQLQKPFHILQLRLCTADLPVYAGQCLRQASGVAADLYGNALDPVSQVCHLPQRNPAARRGQACGRSAPDRLPVR